MSYPLKKIAIVGPESTGKSTLAVELAALFGCVSVPEMARSYLEKRGGKYSEEDLLKLAGLQAAAEDEAAGRSSGLLICDTSLLVVRIWSEVRFGRCHPSIIQEEESRRYDLILLTAADLPWEPDPLREHPEGRQHLFSLYYRALLRKPGPFAVISGTGKARTLLAADKIRTVKSI